MSCLISTIGDGNNIRRHIITTQEPGNNLLDYNAAVSGWVSASGAYPTTNTSYPNAEYVELNVEKDEVIYIDMNTTGPSVQSRVRYGTNGSALGGVTVNTNNTYFYSTFDGTSSGKPEYYKGFIIAKQPFTLIFLGLTGRNDLANIMVSRNRFYEFEPYGNTKTVKHLIQGGK